MRRSFIAAAPAALALSVPGRSADAGALFYTVLSGLQEAPPNASPASGIVTFELNDAETELAFEITYDGLLAGLTAAHFHKAPFGVNGPVVRGLSAAEGAARAAPPA